jgi:hypothetical protein
MQPYGRSILQDTRAASLARLSQGIIVHIYAQHSLPRVARIRAACAHKSKAKCRIFIHPPYAKSLFAVKFAQKVDTSVGRGPQQLTSDVVGARSGECARRTKSWA